MTYGALEENLIFEIQSKIGDKAHTNTWRWLNLIFGHVDQQISFFQKKKEKDSQSGKRGQESWGRKPRTCCGSGILNQLKRGGKNFFLGRERKGQIPRLSFGESGGGMEGLTLPAP